jgi:hypothetical protein
MRENTKRKRAFVACSRLKLAVDCEVRPPFIEMDDTGASPYLDCHVTREFNVDIQELVYNFDQGKLKIRCL